MAQAQQVFYAVAIGRNPGIYATWDECEAEVKGFKGAKYQKFHNRQEAKDFINNQPTADVLRKKLMEDAERRKRNNP